VVVVNPSSGRGRARRSLPRVREALLTAGVDADLRLSEDPGHAPRLAREAVDEGAEIVAALGGDGMVGMVASELIGTPAVLGVIPTGTGNDFARMIGLDRRDPVSAARLLAEPSVVEIDAVRVAGGGREAYYVNVAGAGFDSEVSETANRMRTRVQGTARYVIAVVSTLRSFTPSRFELTVDGERRSLPAMLIAVGNGRSYGGGMKVCPDASLTDARLELCVVGAMSRMAFLRAFPRVFRGTHVTHPKVTMLRGSMVEVAADRRFDVYADGERSVPLPATFQVVPKALRVAVPEGARL
jgi:diacylglycerol kinase (ATP)